MSNPSVSENRMLPASEVMAGQSDLVICREPAATLAEAQQAAAALQDVIRRKRKPVLFNGEQYLEFEDWQTVGRFYGITARVLPEFVQYVQYGDAAGFEATAEAYHAENGKVLSVASSMCLNDEPNWRKKPLYQLRSMAQTRACTKALRNVLSWIVVLAGYRPTPAEEMDGVAEFIPAAAPEAADQQNLQGGMKERIAAFSKLHARLPHEHEHIYQQVLNQFGVRHSNQFRDRATAVAAYQTLLARVLELEAGAAEAAEAAGVSTEEAHAE